MNSLTVTDPSVFCREAKPQTSNVFRDYDASLWIKCVV